MRKLSAFVKLRRRYFVSQRRAAEVFGVTPRTVRNWERHDAPRPVLAWLKIAFERDLGAMHPAWAGWRIGLDGRLHGPHRASVPRWLVEYWLSQPTCPPPDGDPGAYGH